TTGMQYRDGFTARSATSTCRAASRPEAFTEAHARLFKSLGQLAPSRSRSSPERDPPQRMSSRRRRNLLRTLAILVALVVVLAGAGAVYAYRYADRLVRKGQRPVAGLTPAPAGQPLHILLVGSDSPH